MKLKVIANAKADSVEKRGGSVVVRINAPAHGGKANKKLEEFLSGFFGRKTMITKGLKNKQKEILVKGLSDEEALEKI